MQTRPQGEWSDLWSERSNWKSGHDRSGEHFRQSPPRSSHCARTRDRAEKISDIGDSLAERGIRTPETVRASMGGIGPEFGALFGPRKSIRAQEKLVQVAIHRRTFSGFADNL